MAHSKEAHGKHNAMKQFNEGHHEKKMSQPMPADGKYTSGEMDNPEHLKKSVDMLAAYTKKNKMQYP
jgi:hypothetical protein